MKSRYDLMNDFRDQFEKFDQKEFLDCHHKDNAIDFPEGAVTMDGDQTTATYTVRRLCWHSRLRRTKEWGENQSEPLVLKLKREDGETGHWVIFYQNSHDIVPLLPTVK